MLANQIRPTTLSAAIVFRYILFWPNKHRVLLFLAIAQSKSVVFRIYRGRLTCAGAGTFFNPLSPLLVRAICSHAHTHLHILRTQPQLSTQTMNSMKLENAVPLPLEFNEYAEATLDILGEEARMTPTKLWKYKTV